MAKLDVKAFGAALGVVAGAFSLCLGTLSVFFYWDSLLSRAAAVVYLSSARPTVFGVVFSSLSAFVYAFAIGSAIAWLYNRIVDENKAAIDKKIKDTARAIWESKGKPENTSDQDWKEAEKKVRGL